MSWKDNSDDEDGFKIERKISDSSYALVNTLSANATSYSDTGLTSANTYSYRVNAFNSEGDSDYSNEVSATILNDDSTPPDTSITSQPLTSSNQNSANFEFASAESGSTFECQLDSGGWVSCTSPKSYAGLSEGNHTFEVRATDQAGNTDQTPISYSWTVDITLPVQSGWSPASASTIVTKSPGIDFSLNENGDCKWSLSDEGYSIMFGDCTGDGTTSIFCGVSGLLDGANTVYIACRDSVLNSDTAATNTHLAFTVDTTPPAQSGWNPVSGTTASPDITLSLNENGDCRWSLSDQSYDGMTGDCTGDGTAYISCGVKGLSEGANAIYIACRDILGNTDTAAANKHLTYTEDIAPPVQSGWNPVSGSTIVTKSPTIALSLNENGDCKWSLGDKSYADMTGVCAGDGTISISCGLSGLSEGANTVYIACQDSLLNADTAASNTHLTYTVDMPPVQSGWNPASASTIVTKSPAIALSLNENGDCKWSLDDQSYADMTGDCAGDGTISISCGLSGLLEGANTVYIACRDSLGNSDTTISNAHLVYIVNMAPPVQSSWGPASASIIGTKSPTITFTLNENGDCKWSSSDQDYAVMTGDCAGDGTISITCGISGLAEGANTVYIACLDSLLNADTAATNTHLTYNVDTILPDTSITAQPLNPTTQLSATFEFNSLPEVGLIFECKLDAGPWVTCTSPLDYPGLYEGSHTFKVRAVDPASNKDPTPASFTWLINTNIPPTFSGLKDLLALSDTEVMLFWSGATDDSTPQSEIIYDICQSSTSGGCAAGFIATYTVGPNIWNYRVTGLTAGQAYYFLARARDNAGNRDINTVEKKKEYFVAVQVSAGFSHTCARLADNTIKCWGNNYYGQLGNGTNTHSDTPVTVSGINTAVEINAGDEHTCARLADNTIKCWGNNYYGQLGNGTNTNSNIPVTVSGITTGAEISAGDNHTCIRLTNNTTRCWGSNYYGQLGDGTNTNSNIPVTVSDITTATEISARHNHTCVLLTDNTLKCWGYNYYGQLGEGTNTDSNIPVTVSGITTAAEISVGGDHTCARLADNTIKCWGDNLSGELGDGTNTDSNIPVTVSGITTAVEIKAGEIHTCARLADKTAKCWGWNHYGQLGNGTNTQSNTPVTVSGITTAAEIDSGVYHTCARLTDNTIRCWGSNTIHELGNGTNSDSNIPVLVSGISMAAEISTGDSHTCARLADNTIQCWGYNAFGQLGDGTHLYSDVPVTVVGITTAAEISAGRFHTCARLADNTIKCWGKNNSGQLGNGTYCYYSIPVTVSGIFTAVELSAGENHTCVRLNDNSISCWGYNYYGQLGEGTNTDSNIPVTVSGITTAAEISVGGEHTCARLADNTLKCWGYNLSGELGDGTNTNSNYAVTVSGIDTAAEINAGMEHTCARLNNNTVRCWGRNLYGALGNGVNTSSNTPVTVSGITTAAEINAGGYYTCARLSDNTLRCWGENSNGQLGDGTNTNSNIPVTVSGITTAAEISAGYSHTCARLTDNTLRCWGDSDTGQLGAGYFGNAYIPVPVISP